MIPSEDRCLRLLQEHGILPNILSHSLQVRNVSLALADNLIDPSTVDRDLVNAGALLHDIAKTFCLENRKFSHDTLGGKILRDLGYHELALIVESHVLMPDFDPAGKLQEREIVHYADKRVMHDRIVSLDERIEDIIQRYSRGKADESFIMRNKAIISGMEKKIRDSMRIDIETALKGL